MNRSILMVLSVMFLSACGSETSESDKAPKAAGATTKSHSTPMRKPSVLLSVMSEDKICSVLDVAELKTMFNTTSEINTSAMNFRGTFSCDYTWDRVDKEERENNYLNNAMLVAQGKAERLPMRQKVTQHQVNISLSEYKGQAEFFVPAKLTDEQLNAQIESAKKAAADRLTDEQKELAGDAATSLVEGLLKKNNQNQEISELGDAAYWSKVGMGGLSVLDGAVKLYISPMIADTESEDLENAKKITVALLK